LPKNLSKIKLIIIIKGSVKFEHLGKITDKALEPMEEQKVIYKYI